MTKTYEIIEDGLSNDNQNRICKDREKLAEYAHNAWSRWMVYLFSFCYPDTDQLFDKENGNLIIPKDKVDRWKRQINTPYSELSEKEKESDRKEADEIFHIIR